MSEYRSLMTLIFILEIYMTESFISLIKHNLLMVTVVIDLFVLCHNLGT